MYILNILTLSLLTLSACKPAVVVEGDTRDIDGDGYTITDGDCNDNNVNVNPDATERWYDGLDQDCSGGSDFDQDGDGHDDARYANFDRGTSVLPADDCDDQDTSMFIGAAEIWYDGIDQGCNGDFTLNAPTPGDSTMPTQATISTEGSWNDCDQDGDGTDAEEGACHTTSNVDCDDTNPAINPYAAEDNTDGVDNNCNGIIDGFSVAVAWANDSQGSPYVTITATEDRGINITYLLALDAVSMDYLIPIDYLNPDEYTDSTGTNSSIYEEVSTWIDDFTTLTYAYTSGITIASTGTKCVVWGPRASEVITALDTHDHNNTVCTDITGNTGLVPNGDSNWTWNGL